MTDIEDVFVHQLMLGIKVLQHTTPLMLDVCPKINVEQHSNNAAKTSDGLMKERFKAVKDEIFDYEHFRNFHK